MLITQSLSRPKLSFGTKQAAKPNEGYDMMGVPGQPPYLLLPKQSQELLPLNLPKYYAWVVTSNVSQR
ncbi:MAG: hypothetical protein VKJ06_03010 [Vampirovibrionales bacterium]|nr:hypothetical protein [Vampirovibrionales bacterium]